MLGYEVLFLAVSMLPRYFWIFFFRFSVIWQIQIWTGNDKGQTLSTHGEKYMVHEKTK